jgi:hypothetical protein
MRTMRPFALAAFARVRSTKYSAARPEQTSAAKRFKVSLFLTDLCASSLFWYPIEGWEFSRPVKMTSQRGFRL